MDATGEEKRPQGRPKGRRTVKYPLRLLPEQKRDLDILSEIMEGSPPVNGLIQSAVTAYIAARLEDPRLKSRYDARIDPQLRVVG